MANDPELSPYFSMRIDPRVRYFTELAARLRGVSLTDYIEDAILQSFDQVSIDALGELDLADPSNPSKTVAYPLSAQMEALWEEEPILRIEMMCAMGYTALMSDDQRAVWEYIFTQPHLLNGPGKPNRRLIHEQWAVVKAQALEAKKARVN